MDLGVLQGFKARLIDPFLGLLRQGLGPDKLAQCVALGLVIAIFPALGVTTFLSVLVALRLRLNMLAIQSVNYLAYPLQLLLLLPFYRAGEFLFQVPPNTLTTPQLLDLVRQHPLQAMESLWTTTWHAAIVWLLLSLLLVPLMILVLTALFRRLSKGQEALP